MWFYLVAVLGFIPSICLAGKNAGGALIVHTQDAYVFSAGTVCTTTYGTPASCEEAITRSDKDVGTVVWILAAFDSTASPSVSGIYFGIDYDDSLNIDQWKMCAPEGSQELPDSGWPYSGRGNAIAFGTPISGNHLFPFYAFKIDGGTTRSYFRSTANATGGYAAFIDDNVPPQLDVVERFGIVKWYRQGMNDCPGATPPDIDWEPILADVEDPTNRIAVEFIPEALTSQRGWEDPIDLEDLSFEDPALLAALQNVGVTTVQKRFPASEYPDTLGHDISGYPVRLIDLSNAFLLTLPSPEEMVAAIPTILTTPGVVTGCPVTDAPAEVTYQPRDAHYDSLTTPWLTVGQDAQWNMNNDGVRTKALADSLAPCLQAVEAMDVNAQYAWDQSLGDAHVTLAFVDTGLMTSHEDLQNVIALPSYVQDELNTHGSQEWCISHGTRMASLSASTDDTLGVIGICPHCQILDLEGLDITRCPPESCAVHADTCRFMGGWLPGLERAIDYDSLTTLYWPGDIVGVNMSFGAPGRMNDFSAIAGLYNIYRQGRCFIASASDEARDVAQTTWPANLPFVFGVGGSTWEGKFWDRPTTCYTQLNGTGQPNGTGIGPSHYPDGGSVVDICAPASGYMAVAEASDDSDSTYTFTSGQCSGATALVSGAVGLLQSIAYNELGGTYFPPDDIYGLLASAARPFENTPWEESNRSCSACPERYYGKGVLDVGMAAYWAYGWQNWAPWSDDCIRTARKYEGDNEEETWRFELVREFDQLLPPDSLRGHWYQYLVSTDIYFPAVWLGGTGNPVFLGWPQPSLSNTFPGYGGENYWSRLCEVQLAASGVHDCWISKIDPGSGRATIMGYDYARRNPETGEIEFLVPEDEIAMKYTWMCYGPAGVETGEGDRGSHSGPRILSATRGDGGTWKLVCRFDKPGKFQTEVFDVSGRVLRSWEEIVSGAGMRQVEWDGKTNNGRSVSSGIYWLRLTDSVGDAVRKLVVVH